MSLIVRRLHPLPRLSLTSRRRSVDDAVAQVESTGRAEQSSKNGCVLALATGASIRCYLYSETHICAVEVIDTENDAEAIRRGGEMFAKLERQFDPPLDGFEIWDLDRMVHRFSLVAP